MCNQSEVYEVERGISLDINSSFPIFLDFSALRAVRNKFMIFINHSVYGVLL
jgi:hypothetical protein